MRTAPKPTWAPRAYADGIKLPSIVERRLRAERGQGRHYVSAKVANQQLGDAAEVVAMIALYRPVHDRTMSAVLDLLEQLIGPPADACDDTRPHVIQAPEAQTSADGVKAGGAL